MPDEVLRTAGFGANGSWTATGFSGSHWQASQLNDYPTGYVRSTAGGGNSIWHRVASPSAIAIKVNSIIVSARMIGNAVGNEANLFLHLNGSTTSESTISPVNNVSLTLYNGTTRTTKPGGGAWALTDFGASVAGGCGVNHITLATSLDVDEMYYTANVDYASGGFAFLVASIVGAAIGMEHLAGLARYIQAHTYRRIRIRPEEYPAMLQDLREWTHPKRVWYGLAGLGNPLLLTP